mgnify:CR=1 FL=1
MITHTITTIAVTSDLAAGIAFAARLSRSDSAPDITWRRHLLLEDTLYAHMLAIGTALRHSLAAAAPGDALRIRTLPFVDLTPYVSKDRPVDAVYLNSMREITEILAFYTDAGGDVSFDQAPEERDLAANAAYALMHESRLGASSRAPR